MESTYTKIISFVARGANSGKTSLIEKLIPEFKSRGKKITAIKHAPHIKTFDTPGKDSMRFAEHGADRVMVFSDHGFMMYEDTQPTTDYLALLAGHDADIVFVEGFKKGPFTRIEVFNDNLPSTPLCIENKDYAAVISPTRIDVPGTAWFSPDDIKGICDFIEELVCSHSTPLNR